MRRYGDADACYKAIEKKYEAPAWATFAEVRNSTGSTAVTRYADAMAFGVWPSRGYQVIGFEIKVSRSDWLAELKNPAKSDEIQKFCHEWWIVVPDERLVKNDELPETWGLAIARGGKLVTVKPAPKLPAVEPTRGFMASVLRQSAENLRKEFDRGHAEAFTKASLRAAEQYAELVSKPTDEQERVWKKKYDELEQRVAAFTAKSGIDIQGRAQWEIPRLGEAVKATLEMYHGFDPIASMENVADAAKRYHGEVLKHVEQMKKIRKEIKKDGV